MNFGHDGARSSFRHYNNENRAEGKEGDVAPLKSNSNRKPWSIAHIIKTFADKHGIVRTIKLRLGDASGVDQREWVWPITKILLTFFALLYIAPDRQQRMLRTLQNYRVILGDLDDTMASLMDN